MTAPYSITQLGMKSGKLLVHEISVCSRISSLLPTEIKPVDDRVASVSWTFDGNLLVCDVLGNVWLMGSDGKRRSLVIGADSNPSLTSGRKIPVVAATQGGILVADLNSQIRVSSQGSELHLSS